MFALLTVMMELNISVLFGLGKYDVIYDNIKYPIRLKNAITYGFFHIIVRELKSLHMMKMIHILIRIATIGTVF